MDDALADDSDIDLPPGPPPRAVIAGCEALPEHVLGFPLHVALTIGAEPPGATLHFLLAPSLESTADAVGYRLVAEGRSEVAASHGPRPVFAMDPDEPGLTLSAGSFHRAIVDLAPLLPARLPEGRYRLTVVYVSPFGADESGGLDIDVRAPSAAERRSLDKHLPEVPRGGSWSDWVRAPAADKGALRGPFAAADPLAYLRALRWLLRGDDDLADIDPRALDGLPALYAPEVECWKAELARARGDVAAFDAAEARLTAMTRGLARAVAAAREGESELSMENDARRERKRLGA